MHLFETRMHMGSWLVEGVIRFVRRVEINANKAKTALGKQQKMKSVREQGGSSTVVTQGYSERETRAGRELDALFACFVDDCGPNVNLGITIREAPNLVSAPKDSSLVHCALKVGPNLLKVQVRRREFQGFQVHAGSFFEGPDSRIVIKRLSGQARFSLKEAATRQNADPKGVADSQLAQ